MRIKGKQLENTLRTASNPFDTIHSTQFVGAVEGSIRFKCKNAETSAMSKGQAVYISGVSGNLPEVKLADADGTGTIPSVGLTESAANANAEVFVVSFGNLTGLDTSSLNTTSPSQSIVGRSVFIGATAGQITIDKPSGSSAKLQNIGQIVREHATEGIIKVGGAGRTAATPNLDQGTFFIGNANNQSSESVYTLPIADGSDGQVLTTDGNGAVTFADAGGGGSAPSVDEQNTTATLSSPSAGTLEEVYTVNSSSAVTLTLVSAVTVGEGFKYQIKRLGTGAVTVDPAGSEYIDHSGQSTFSIGAQYDSITLISDGSNWLLI